MVDSSDSRMEPSQAVVQGAEGCSDSSESGWTTYIGSPACENESLSDEDTGKLEEFSGGEEEDDSMASDASSGPSDRHKNDVVEDHTSPKPNHNCKQVMRRSMQKEERRRRSRDKSPQELVISNAATGFSRVQEVRKHKLG